VKPSYSPPAVVNGDQPAVAGHAADVLGWTRTFTSHAARVPHSGLRRSHRVDSQGMLPAVTGVVEIGQPVSGGEHPEQLGLRFVIDAVVPVRIRWPVAGARDVELVQAIR
jgi:hypothetical protein